MTSPTNRSKRRWMRLWHRRVSLKSKATTLICTLATRWLSAAKQQLTVYSSGWGYGPGWYGGGWYGPSGGITNGSTIYTGQLAVDMYDAPKHELVRRGVASKTLETKAKPKKRQKNLNKAVAKLMKNYPPEVKK